MLSGHEDAISKGERAALLLLLEDMHIYADGRPPHKSPYAGIARREPYTPFCSCSNILPEAVSCPQTLTRIAGGVAKPLN